MEVLTKDGLKSLWDKLKSSFILKKGGGTIINNGDDTSKWKDYKLSINHTGFSLRDDDDKFRIRLSPDDIELKYKTNNIGTTITDNTFYMPGVLVTGDEGSSSNSSSVRVYGSSDSKYTSINKDGIKSYNGTNKEVYTRDGSYATIGTSAGNLVALDENGKLPSAVGNYVPLDKASTITIVDKDNNSFTYSIDNRIILKNSINSCFSIFSNARLLFSSEDSQLGIVDMSCNGIKLTNNTIDITVPSSTNAPVILVGERYSNLHTLVYNDSIETKRGNSFAKYTYTGVDLGDANGTYTNAVLGTSKNFYKLNAANGIPQLNANGKLSDSVLPSSVISDVLVNGTSVVSNGVANITPLDLFNKTFETTINNQYFGYNLDGLHADKIYSGYKWNNFSLQTVKLYSKKVSDDLIAGRLDLVNYSTTSSSASGNTTIALNSADGLIECNGITVNSGNKDDIHVFNTNGGVTSLRNYLPLTGGTLTGDLHVESTLALGLGLLTLGTIYGACGLLMGNSDYDASGKELANLKIHSWNGISFTTTTSTAPFYNKTAVGIDCRSGNLYVGNNIVAKGTISGNSTSDIRLKENLKEADSLNIIESLGDIYTFTYKDTKEDSIGLIALNVKDSQLSDLVTENSEGYLGINYWSPKLVCLALGAAQLLNKKVKELEKQIEELKSK